jgi:hypothetical protein
VRELITKGAMGMAAIITVDDIHKTYEELVAGEAELFAGAPLGKSGRRFAFAPRAKHERGMRVLTPELGDGL